MRAEFLEQYSINRCRDRIRRWCRMFVSNIVHLYSADSSDYSFGISEGFDGFEISASTSDNVNWSSSCCQCDACCAMVSWIRLYLWLNARAHTHTQRHSSYSATHVIDVPGYQMKCNVSSSNNNQNKKQNVVYFLRISVRLDSLARLVINQRIDWTTHLIDFISQQNGYIIINTYIGISTEQPMTHSHTHTWSRQGRVVAGRLRVDEHTWFC